MRCFRNKEHHPQVMEQDFEKLYSQLYPNNQFDENLDVANYNITESDVECFEKMERIVSDSAADPSILEITNDAYFFL